MDYSHLIQEMTWSHSRIATYHDCPYSFYLKYITLEPDEPRFFSSYGSFIHRILEKFYKKELKKNELAPYYLEHFSTQVQGAAPSASVRTKYFLDGLTYFQNFSSLYAESFAECHFDFQIDNLQFTGIVDLIAKTPDNILAIVDHKAKILKDKKGRPSKEAQKILRQMYIYSYGFYQDTGRWPDQLHINCYRIGQTFTYPFDEQQAQSSAEWAVQSIRQIMVEKEWLPIIEPFKCRYICGVSDHCEYYQMFKG